MKLLISFFFENKVYTTVRIYLNGMIIALFGVFICIFLYLSFIDVICYNDEIYKITNGIIWT